MELSSPELIRSLNIHYESIYQKSFAGEIPAANQQSHRKRHCKCGQCRDCIEDARWDRIFAEKFADPNYYGRLRLRRESPVNSF